MGKDVGDNFTPIRCKIVIDIEAAFTGDDNSAETLLFCLQEDIEDAGGYVIHSAEIITD